MLPTSAGATTTEAAATKASEAATTAKAGASAAESSPATRVGTAHHAAEPQTCPQTAAASSTHAGRTVAKNLHQDDDYDYDKKGNK